MAPCYTPLIDHNGKLLTEEQRTILRDLIAKCGGQTHPVRSRYGLAGTLPAEFHRNDLAKYGKIFKEPVKITGGAESWYRPNVTPKMKDVVEAKLAAAKAGSVSTAALQESKLEPVLTEQQNLASAETRGEVEAAAAQESNAVTQKDGGV